MDARHFDHLTRTLSRVSARRGLLRLLAVLPFLGGLALVGEEEAAAKDRRRRRKARHRRRTGKHKRKRTKNTKRCKAARLCAGQCGTVKKKRCKPVDCGSCACTPPCPVCQTCDAATTQCVPNAAADGQACGEPGQICTQGSCGCGAQACFDAGGCCAGAACVPTDFQSDPAHCGSCQTVCAAGEACVNGACCLPSTADLQAVIDAAAPGAAVTLCPGTWNVTATVSIGKDLTLRGAGAGQTVLDGGDAVTVLAAAALAPVTLQDLTITRGNAAFGGGIFNGAALTLRGVAVTACAATNQGGGIYTNSDLTLEDGSRILDNSATTEGGGIRINGGTTTLKAGSRVAGNSGVRGGGIFNGATLILEDDSLIGGASPAEANSAHRNGGGIYNDFGATVTLQGGRVAGNSTTTVGGGIYSDGAVTLQGGSRVAGNSASSSGGGIYSNGDLTLEGGSLVGGDTPAEANSASTGGGIANFGDATLKTGSRISGNTSTISGGGAFNNGTLTLEADALVCGNSAPQCSGVGTFNGVCPNPATGICPPA